MGKSFRRLHILPAQVTLGADLLPFQIMQLLQMAYTSAEDEESPRMTMSCTLAISITGFSCPMTKFDIWLALTIMLV